MQRDSWQRTASWLVAGATLLGAFLRFSQLAHLPISTGFDPAYYGLDALAILDGERPIYLATNYGREALFSYLVALLFGAGGVSDFGIHLASAYSGILTIPMTYAVAGELLRFSERRMVRRWAPVLAAFLMAASYWHVVWSRYGVRAILAPLFVSLTMFLLLRALRTGRARLFVLAGAAAGASLYTYQIGQLVPPLVAAVLVIAAWHRRRTLDAGDALRRLALLLLPFLLLAGPLALYAWQHPAVFNQRVRDVVVVEAAQPPAAQAATLVERLLILLRFFSVEGDTHGMWSVGRLPGLNPVLLAAFVAGLLVLARHWRRPLAQAALAWLLIMLAPGVLAGSGAVSKRALGALPVIMCLGGLGLGSVAALVSSRLRPGPWRKTAAALIMGGAVLFTLAHTYNQYFVVWAADEDKDGRFDPHLSEMGSYIAGLPPETQIYLSADAPNHPNMLLHSRLRTATDDVRGYNGWRCFVYPQTTARPTTYVLSEENSLNRLRETFPGGRLQQDGLSNAYGYEDYYMAYHIPPHEAAAAGPQTAVDARWGEQIALLGYDLAQTAVTPGERLSLTLYWRPLRAMDTRYTAFVHLLGEPHPQTGSPLWGQKDSEPCHGYYPTAVWRPGEIIRDEIAVDVPPDAPPGRYQLAVGFYTWPDFRRLPTGDGDTFVLGEVDVRAAGAAPSENGA